MTLINENLAGLKVASSFGELSFNEKGECHDLKADQEKAFEGLAGYTVVTKEEKKETKAEKAKEEKKEVVKEDKKEEPKKSKKPAAKKETGKK